MNRNYYGEYRTLHEDKPNGCVGFDDPFKEDIEYALRYRQLTEDFTTGEFSGGHTKRKTVTEYSTDMCSVTGKTTVKIDKSKHINLFALLFTIFVIVALMFISFISLSNTFHYTTMTTRFNTRASEYTKSEPNNQEKAKKPYSAMAVIEEETNRLLYGFEEDKRLPMASTTKIATAIIAIENCDDLNKKIVVPSASVGIEGSSIYLRRGEELTIKDLLYGLMLASGNDCAVALAIITSGTEEAFVNKMNELATSLNLVNTHFKNPHGLHDEDHYTTAKDLAILTSYAMKNETFAKIVSTKRYTIETTNLTDNRYLKNKQKLMFKDELIKDGIIINGVKSGFTPEAGRCLVTSGYMNDVKVIAVVLDSPNMFDESESLVKKALNEFKYYQLVTPNMQIFDVPVLNGFSDSVSLYSVEGFRYPLSNEEYNLTKINAEYENPLIAPIEKGEEVGEVSVVIEEREVFSTPIYTMESVRSNKYSDIVNDVIENF